MPKARVSAVCLLSSFVNTSVFCLLTFPNVPSHSYPAPGCTAASLLLIRDPFFFLLLIEHPVLQAGPVSESLFSDSRMLGMPQCMQLRA